MKARFNLIEKFHVCQHIDEVIMKLNQSSLFTKSFCNLIREKDIKIDDLTKTLAESQRNNKKALEELDNNLA
jgi:hypothetical protein